MPRAAAWRTVAAWLFAGAIFVFAVTSAVQARREERATRDELASLSSLSAPLSALARRRPGPQRILVNGHPVVVAAETVSGTAEGALDVVTRACASDDPRVALGLPPRGDDGSPPDARLHLRSVKRQAAAGASAALCVFENDGGEDPRARNEPGEDLPSPRARYALAREVDGGRVALVSVTAEAESTLAELFPETGDAPGSDPPYGARPPGARRVLTAEVVGEAYAVRLYEVSGPRARAVLDYDHAMGASGWVSSPSVRGTFEDARLFLRGGDELVVSFDARAGTTTIALASAPFGAAGPPVEAWR